MPTQTEWLKRYQSSMMHNFGLPKTVFVRGEGCSLWDADGNRYTDMFSGIAVGGLGHAHPAVLQAVSEQLAALGHISNLFASPPQIELAERLAQLATGGDPAKSARVYFANSGGLVSGWDLGPLVDGTGEPTRTLRFWNGDDTDASIVIDGEAS